MSGDKYFEEIYQQFFYGNEPHKEHHCQKIVSTSFCERFQIYSIHKRHNICENYDTHCFKSSPFPNDRISRPADSIAANESLCEVACFIIGTLQRHCLENFRSNACNCNCCITRSCYRRRRPMRLCVGVFVIRPLNVTGPRIWSVLDSGSEDDCLTTPLQRQRQVVPPRHKTWQKVNRCPNETSKVTVSTFNDDSLGYDHNMV